MAIGSMEMIDRDWSASALGMALRLVVSHCAPLKMLIALFAPLVVLSNAVGLIHRGLNAAGS